MTTPSDPENGESTRDGVDLGKPESARAGGTAAPTADVPFDPYRFGKPDHPIPAEYAPPGYTGPIAPAAPPSAPPPAAGPYAGAPINPYGPPPGPQQGNPFANPPGTPYGPNPQQPPYQSPMPYGYGAPPPYHGYAQPRSTNSKAIAALVLGILSIVFCWLSVFDAVFVILALIFGLLALSETKNGRSGGRGMAVAGLICMVIGAILATIISIKVFSAVDKCGGFNQSDRSSFNQCLRDNI
jgi:hypothetical protein